MKSNKITWTEWIKLKQELSESSITFTEAADKLPDDIKYSIIEKSEWTQKDVLSHMAGWEVQVVDQFRAFLSNLDTDDNYDIDAFNRTAVLNRKNKSWNKTMQEFKSAGAELSVLLERSTEDNLHSDPRFVEWVKVLIAHNEHHSIQLEKLQE